MRKEVEAEVQKIETETVYYCDACGLPCDERGGDYTFYIGADGALESYDICGVCLEALGETEQTLETALYEPEAETESSDPSHPLLPLTRRSLTFVTLMVVMALIIIPESAAAVELAVSISIGLFTAVGILIVDNIRKNVIGLKQRPPPRY